MDHSLRSPHDLEPRVEPLARATTFIDDRLAAMDVGLHFAELLYDLGFRASVDVLPLTLALGAAEFDLRAPSAVATTMNSARSSIAAFSVWPTRRGFGCFVK